MSQYIHHIPGRLRLKLDQIKRQPLQARKIQAAIGSIDGVLAVSVNVTTGSVLIRYEAARINGESLLRTMRETGLLPPPQAREPQRRHASSPVAEKVADMLVEKLIERSAIALIGAFL